MDAADGFDTDFTDTATRDLYASANALGLQIIKYGEANYVLTDGHLNINFFSSIADIQAEITFLQSQQGT